MKNNQWHMEIANGDVTWIRGDDRHRGIQNIRVVEELYEGKDNMMRAVILWSKNTIIERPIQCLYPLELNFDSWKRQKKRSLMQQVTTTYQCKQV